MEETDLDQLGPDGISPLCAAATWGYTTIVQLLLDATCDVNVRNGDSTRSTSLHVASCQEHHEITALLLAAGADALLLDAYDRTPCDFASVSDDIWPLFEARGLCRTSKPELVQKRLIRKLGAAEERAAESRKGATVAAYTRPGSAYVRSDANPGSSCGTSARLSTASNSSKLPTVPEFFGRSSPIANGLVESSEHVIFSDDNTCAFAFESFRPTEQNQESQAELDSTDGLDNTPEPDFPDEISVASGAGRAAAAFLRSERGKDAVPEVRGPSVSKGADEELFCQPSSLPVDFR
ncbi:MAG: hypothetical protein SGPRY_003070 [Prymnesium sp.]